MMFHAYSPRTASFRRIETCAGVVSDLIALLSAPEATACFGHTPEASMSTTRMRLPLIAYLKFSSYLIISYEYMLVLLMLYVYISRFSVVRSEKKTSNAYDECSSRKVTVTVSRIAQI
jgi:hypothetical protein